MTTQIYSDSTRTIDLSNGCIIITGRKNINIMITDTLTTSAVIPAEYAKALKAQGQNPDGWYVLADGKIIRACLPISTREAITTAIAEYRTELNTKRNDSCNIERGRIYQMYAKAEAHKDYPSEYFPLKADADKALAAWKEKYPEAAKDEQKSAMLANAEALRNSAKNALLYDADGWLSCEDRQARHDGLMKQAADLESKANAL